MSQSMKASPGNSGPKGSTSSSKFLSTCSPKFFMLLSASPFNFHVFSLYSGIDLFHFLQRNQSRRCWLCIHFWYHRCHKFYVCLAITAHFQLFVKVLSPHAFLENSFTTNLQILADAEGQGRFWNFIANPDFSLSLAYYREYFFNVRPAGCFSQDAAADMENKRRI